MSSYIILAQTLSGYRFFHDFYAEVTFAYIFYVKDNFSIFEGVLKNDVTVNTLIGTFINGYSCTNEWCLFGINGYPMLYIGSKFSFHIDNPEEGCNNPHF